MTAKKKICVIDGHPDPSSDRYIKALCSSYENGAVEGGHEVRSIHISSLDFGFMSSANEFAAEPPESIIEERLKIIWADHVVIAFPLWLGSMPAKLRAFFEHASKGEFFLKKTENKKWPIQMMKGKSARVIVTMGMPSLIYRFMMDEGALKALERGLLGISGFQPIHHDTIGGIDSMSVEQRQKWLQKIHRHGELAE